MHEQLDHLLHCARHLENLVTQVPPLGTGQHLFMGMTITLLRFAPPAPDITHADIPERDRFSDREAEAISIAKRFELLKAKALGREESLDPIAAVAREVQGEDEPCMRSTSGSLHASRPTARPAWWR